MINSAVTFSALTNPTFNKKTFPQTFGNGPDAFVIDSAEVPYFAQIKDIINDSRVLVSNPFSIKSEFSKTGRDKSPFDKEFDDKFKDSGHFAFDASDFSISFRKKPTFTQTQNLRSFAKIKLNDLNTFSGDIHHIKTFMTSQGSVGGFELVDETVLEASELLINENSIDLKEPIGEFFSQAIIDDNWIVSSSNTAINEFTASRETSNLNNSVFLSGSIRNHKYLGRSDIDFTTSETGNGKILFHVKKGLWRFSDISIRSVKESGFNPATTTLYIPIPTEAQDDVLDFEFKFYDNDNNEASASFQKLDNDFAGGNTFIGGGSNLVTGSVFIGNSTGSGMEMAGINSAFMRSVGYEGFISASAGSGRPGFMFYSGSVLPNSGDNYDGVGFELNDGISGSMVFRTDTGVFDVKTPSFFLGSNNQFVSGALGNIEISSSNFHLDANGDVTMQGTITATAGDIAGWSVESDKIAKNGVELNSAESGLRVVNSTGREVVYVGSRSLQEVTGSATTSSFNGSFEIATFNSSQSGGGMILSSSNQISGWTMNFTGSAGAIKIESNTTYPSASFIAVDGDNAIVVVNPPGVST